MKVGMNLTVLEEADGMWILGDDEGHKYHLPVPFTGEASDLGGLISDIEAENDDYARTVIPLIKRILADDYSQTELFAEIGAALDKVEGETANQIRLDITGSPEPVSVKEAQEIAKKVGYVAVTDDGEVGPICGALSNTGLGCTLPLAHHGPHKATITRTDPETGKPIVAEEWHD